MENTNKEIKNVYAKLQEARVLIQNDRMDEDFSTNSMFTMDRMCNIVKVSDGRVPSGNRIWRNNKYDRNIFKAFKPYHNKSYGPVLLQILQGHQILAGGVGYN